MHPFCNIYHPQFCPKCLFNNTEREKLCFTLFSTRMAPWLVLAFFIYLHNQLSSIHAIITFIKYRCLKNFHSSNSENEWLLLFASFTAKFEVLFVLTVENAFSKRFHFKANRKTIDSSKKQYYAFSK